MESKCIVIHEILRVKYKIFETRKYSDSKFPNLKHKIHKK